jgi:methylated-DNA-[protein]-cysteine S-methyltransferase
MPPAPRRRPSSPRWAPCCSREPTRASPAPGSRDRRTTPAPCLRPSAPTIRSCAARRRSWPTTSPGRSTRFDLPLDLHGTPFQRGVWQALLGIDAGRTRSYGQVAQQLGAPTASRAVGAAVGKNPVSVIVPCHRVIGHGGALTGYAGGVERKRALLALEGAIA